MANTKNLILKAISHRQAERLRGLACDVVWRSGTASLLSKFRDDGPAIFAYHSIGGHGLFCDNVLPVEIFETQIAFLANNYTITPLSKIVETLRNHKRPSRRCAALTFDDGYRDFIDHALPILRHHNAPSTFFVPTDVVNGKPLFFDMLYSAVKHCATDKLAFEHNGKRIRLSLRTEAQREEATLRLALVARPMSPGDREAFLHEIYDRTGKPKGSSNFRYVSSEDLRNLDDSVEIGSHSCGHHNLAVLPGDQLEAELTESKRILEELSGREVSLLAYPFGKPWSFDQRVREMTRRAGYTGAVTTVPGLAAQDTDVYSIPRFGATESLSRYRLNCRGICI